jgi:hypothetical protein
MLCGVVVPRCRSMRFFLSSVHRARYRGMLLLALTPRNHCARSVVLVLLLVLVLAVVLLVAVLLAAVSVFVPACPPSLALRCVCACVRVCVRA